MSAHSGRSLRALSILALLASILLAGLSLLCLKLGFSHKTLERSYLPVSIYEILPDNSKQLLFSDEASLSLAPSPEAQSLFVENTSPREITLVVQEQSFTLSPNSALSLSPSQYSRNFSALDQRLWYYFVCDEAALQEALLKEESREIVFQNDIPLSAPLSFSSPCRIDTGSFSLTGEEGLWYRSTKEGTLTVLSKKKGALLLYADAPQTQIHFSADALSYPQNLWDYYLKVEAVNGRSANPLRNPVANEAMLRRLATDPVCPPTEGATIEFCESFSLSEDVVFSCAYSLNFIKAPEFNGKRLCFSSSQAQTIAITTSVAIDPSALSIDAPNAHLLWQGKEVPETELLCDTMDVATINRESPSLYRLGGDSRAKILSFTLHNENFVTPIELTQEGNLLVGTLDYLDREADLKQAFPQYEVEGGTLDFFSACSNPDGSLDLSRRTVVELTDSQGRISRYRIQVERSYHDLPVVEIHTENGAEVESKKDYLNASIRMIPNGNAMEELRETQVQIRGRGNSTWEWEKKPYKLKFYEDLSLFGLAPSNEWVLLSNYADKSLIRNRLAYEMAKELSFEYTPTQYCVDVFVNGEYQGVYTFGEHLEAAEGRVELAESFAPEETGYLIEIGGVDSTIHKKGVDYFHAGTLRFALVKSPGQGRLSSEQFDYISDLLIKTDEAIVNGGDWRQYIDEQSLIDWILLSELSNNTDCAFRRSCYFTKNPGEKLKMGPVWDFDLAFGNFNRDNREYNTWASTTDDDYVGNTWLAYLLQDEAFVEAMYQRWMEVKDRLLETAYGVIDQTQETLSLSAQENFRRWDVLNIRTEMQHSDVTIYNTHEKQLQYLKDFLRQRASWLTKELTRMINGGTYEIPVIPEED